MRLQRRSLALAITLMGKLVSVAPAQSASLTPELQKALDSDPAYAPFVPANLDKRSESVRVILRFQSVDVNTRRKRGKKLP